MSSMYEAVTVNLSHIASLIIMRLFEQGLRDIECGRMHKMLYLGIKLLQRSEPESDPDDAPDASAAALAQISEFSLIIVAIGVKAG